MRRTLIPSLLVLLSLSAASVPGSGQTPTSPGPTSSSTSPPTCTQADLAAVVDDMGAKLRTSSTAEYPRLQARMRQLAAVKGWPEVEAEAKAQDLLEDRESRALDEKAGQLLIELDRKGPSETISPTCAQVTELKSIANQLLEVTRAKSAHSIARLDIELGVRPTATAKAPDAKPDAKPELKLETKPADAAPKRPAIASAAPVPPLAPSPSLPPSRSQVPQVPLPWDTQTVRTPTPSPPVVSPPDAPSAGSTQPWNQPVASVDLEFTQEDIRAAGRGVFGTISAELASVIEHAFKSYGRPTGYIRKAARPCWRVCVMAKARWSPSAMASAASTGKGHLSATISASLGPAPWCWSTTCRTPKRCWHGLAALTAQPIW
jgi:hypothetical protein